MALMIIKTKKMSAKEVKKKFHDFIDELSEDCGPELEQMAEDLKGHGDEFIDALSGESVKSAYRKGFIEDNQDYRFGGSGNFKGGSDGYREGYRDGYKHGWGDEGGFRRQYNSRGK